MSEVREEYTRENYPSFGKKYNGEKAIISLTSWRARINTVSKTLFSLLKQCPGFHIVLVLSEEEFPKMMDELPENLMLFVENEMIELLFVYKNYKSFKKVLFTMDKYRDVPVISADDDCIYTCNYAQELYDIWLNDKFSLVSVFNAILFRKYQHHCGAATLYPPHAFAEFTLELLNNNILNTNEDDVFYTLFLYKFGRNKTNLLKKTVFFFYNEIQPLHDFYKNKEKQIFQTIEKELGLI